MHAAPETFGSCALLTQDGVLAGMSAIPVKHPLYGFDAHEATVDIPLKTSERALLEEIRRGIGHVEFSMRSALAQLGIEGFETPATEYSLRGATMRVRTLFTDVRNKTHSKVIKGLLQLLSQGKTPTVARAGLLPDAARLRCAEIAVGRDAGDLEALPVMGLEDDDIGFLLHDREYFLLDAGLSPDVIKKMFGNGSARSYLEKLRLNYPLQRDELYGREYFLGGITVNTHKHHVVLQSQTVRDGLPSPVVHTRASRILDGKRTTGTRQVELFNPTSETVPLDGLAVTAHVYRADPSHEVTETC